MKNFLFAVVFCVVTMSSVVFAEESTVRFSEDSWPPYTYGESGMPPTGGIAVNLVHEVFSRLGVKVDLMLYPWKRCLSQMKSGKRDALMLCGYSKEREEYVVYTDVVMVVKDLLCYRKFLGSLEWEEYADLKPYSFARTAGFQYGDDFEQAVQEHGIKIHSAPSDLHSFRMLALGRVDAFICNEITAKEIFKKTPELQGQIMVAQKSIKEGPMFMAFSKHTPAKALVPRVNQVIEEMKKDGTIQRLLNEF